MITLLLCLMYFVAAWFFTLYSKEIIKTGHPELDIPDNLKNMVSLVFGAFFPLFLIWGFIRIMRKNHGSY